MGKDLEAAADVAVKTCMGMVHGETAAVICDEPCFQIGRSLWKSVKKHGGEAIFCEIFPRRSNGEEPPAAVSDLLKRVDIALIPTSKSISHTEARREASRIGVRIATMPGITTDTMLRTLSADYVSIAKLSTRLAEFLEKGKTLNLKTAKGTDLTLDIERRQGYADTGLNHQRGSFSNLPAGEAYIAPMENRAFGRVVFDGSFAGVGILDPQNIVVEIENGYATKFSGGEKAKQLYNIMEPFGKPAFNIAELGIGTNDKAIVTGNVIEDEKVLGTVHVAFGDNRSMGGNIAVPSHLDGVIMDPTVIVDGMLLMDNGILKIT